MKKKKKSLEKEKYQANNWTLASGEGPHCGAAKSFVWAFREVTFIYSVLNSVDKKKGMEGAPVSQLVIALSQSSGSPFSAGPVYCAPAEEPALSLSAVSPHSPANW